MHPVQQFHAVILIQQDGKCHVPGELLSNQANLKSLVEICIESCHALSTPRVKPHSRGALLSNEEHHSEYYNYFRYNFSHSQVHSSGIPLPPLSEKNKLKNHLTKPLSASWV